MSTKIMKIDMGLSIKKLLDDYLSKEQVQNALRDIGEPTSGNKDELVQRLRNNWESYNRDIYELLDFTDKDSLEMICYYYNLDATPAKQDVLRRRIKKANLLGSGKRPTAQVDRSHDSLIPKSKPSSMVDDSRFYSKKPKIKSENNSQVTDVHFHIGSITHSKGGKMGIVLGIVGIVVSNFIIFWMILIFYIKI
jgi:hypothetical protein